MQRHADAPPGVDPLAHLEAQPARHEGDLLAVAQVVEVGAVAARDLQHVAKALGGDQRGLRARPLRDGVDDGRPAVDEVIHGVGVELRLIDGVEHAPRQIVRRAERLGDAERAGLLVEVDEIGEGPADIGRQSAHCVLPASRRRRLFTAAGGGQTGRPAAPEHRLSCNCNTDVTIDSRRFGKNRRVSMVDDREPACACLDAIRCQTGGCGRLGSFCRFAIPSSRLSVLIRSAGFAGV